MVNYYDIRNHIRAIAPNLSDGDVCAIAHRALDRAHLFPVDPDTPEGREYLHNMTRAYVRHVFTTYDTLLEHGYNRAHARWVVAPVVEKIMQVGGL